MFSSVAASYQQTVSGGDVKELIPEFFYLPDFLRNDNRFNFGQTQSGRLLDDVELPPWANGSAEEFVRLNREALESDYVSAHLHEWIDLIFGYKQRGKEAELAYNTFSHMSYEGSVDLDKIEDPQERASAEHQILNFGQTPTQLFKTPHPQRKPAPAFTPVIWKTLDTLHAWCNAKCSSLPGTPRSDSSGSLSRISSQGDPLNRCIVSFHCLDKPVGGDQNNHGRLVSITSRGMITAYKAVTGQKSSSWSEYEAADLQTVVSTPPFVPDVVGSVFGNQFCGAELAEQSKLCQDLFAVTTDGRYVFSCGYWDNTFRVNSVDTGAIEQYVSGHKSVVTCIATGSDGVTLVTGSCDTTVRVWDILTPSQQQTAMAQQQQLVSAALQKQDQPSGAEDDDYTASLQDLEHIEQTCVVCKVPRWVLFGHDDEVTCVDVNCELDIVVSGGKDGTLLLHTLQKGGFVWSLQPFGPVPITRILTVPIQGHIVAYSSTHFQLAVVSVNGRVLATTQLHDRIIDMAVVGNGTLLAIAGQSNIVFRNIHDLVPVHRIDLPHLQGRLTSITAAPNSTFIVGGCSNGKLVVLAKVPPSPTTTKTGTMRPRDVGTGFPFRGLFSRTQSSSLEPPSSPK